MMAKVPPNAAKMTASPSSFWKIPCINHSPLGLPNRPPAVVVPAEMPKPTTIHNRPTTPTALNDIIIMLRTDFVRDMPP